MWFEQLHLEDFRCHEALHLRLEHSPWVVLAGRNGTGKTSLLEAIYTTTRGHSFRRATIAEIIRAGRDQATVVLDSVGDRAHRLGARYGRNDRIFHLDGARARGLAEINAAIPVDYMGAQAHRLVDGSPGARRRYLDWCLFHVEPRFLDLWRNWHHAHRQRNAWLRQGDYPASTGWSEEVVKYGEKVSEMRAALVCNLDARLQEMDWAAIGNDRPTLKFRQGWQEGGLREALRATADRERRAGRAVAGPHQDDWTLSCGGMQAGQLSRGQTKLASFYLWNARAQIMRKAGRSAILLADDFLADLDEEASRLALRALRGNAGQVWLAVREESARMVLPGEAVRFHVEPGQVVRY
ncbi:MAG: DNA replication and repair protein RecF [Gammaproteobacteria bacterium]|nr:DNA replication and repair protein RecF [Gammaproteobacteria bacterium]